jgi:hypothetical protein
LEAERASKITKKYQTVKLLKKAKPATNRFSLFIKNDLILSQRQVYMSSACSCDWTRTLDLNRGAQKLTGENLKVVWAEFSTLG